MEPSVIIPCYNEFVTAEKIVEPIRCGPVSDVEIILVDDFSTDGTRELLQQNRRVGSTRFFTMTATGEKVQPYGSASKILRAILSLSRTRTWSMTRENTRCSWHP